jgi:hypothetical protein
MVSKRTRFEVLRRDGYTCRYCRTTAGELTVDHVRPTALGGTDDPSNLVACCKDCNAGKSSTSPDEETVEQVKDDAIRWASAMVRAGEILSEKADARSDYVGAFMDAWPQYRYLPSSILDTVERFFEMGLPVNVMVDAVVTATTAKGVYDRPAYFAGICWKRIRAMQDIAEEIVGGGSDA